MKINKYIGWAVCSMLMASCQSDDALENPSQDSEVYTLIGQINNEEPESRAQIELGCQDAWTEYFFWNEGDHFTLYQHLNNELVANDFVISEDYSEANGGDQYAEFSSTTTLTPSASYTAVYPCPTTVTDNMVRLEFKREIDFTSAVTDTERAEVWKNYFNDNMFMVASGTVSESGRNYVQFNHLTTLARITYINQTGSQQLIDGVHLSGQNFGTYMNYDLVNNRETGSGSSSVYTLTTTGLTVEDKDTVDLYFFFFPKAIEQTDLGITIQQSAGNKTLTLPWKDILTANGNNASFRAGMRYWFDVTDTGKGLEWTKNTAEEGWIVFENKEFSDALYETLGNYKVLMTEEGFAKITQNHVNSIYELDFSSYKGKISTLNGMENFRNLQTLKCNNFGLEIDTLDLSMFASLRHLELAGNNLKALKFPVDTRSMNYLDCHDNKIDSLDITGLKNIEYGGTLICGSQKDNISLKLIMNDNQKNQWESDWMNHEWNENVVYDGMSQEAEMKLAAKNGGTFNVTERIRLTSPLIVESNLTLEFSNGAFDGDEGQFVDASGWKAMVVVKPGASLALNGNPEFNTGHKLTQLSCIRMIGGSSEPSKLVMNGGMLIGTYHAILIDEDCQNAEVEINGGGLSCDWWGEFKGVTIFNKSNAKITINNGSFRSPLSGGKSVTSVETWGGELNILGGTFETGFSDINVGIPMNPNVGNTLHGPAIAIAPKRDVTVNISGGTFNGEGSCSFFEKVVDDIILNNDMPNISLAITGGTFNASVMSQDCTGFISGGRFKVQPKDIYLVEGKSASLQGDYYEIVEQTSTDTSGSGNDFNNGGEF